MVGTKWMGWGCCWGGWVQVVSECGGGWVECVVFRGRLSGGEVIVVMVRWFLWKRCCRSMIGVTVPASTLPVMRTTFLLL